MAYEMTMPETKKLTMACHPGRGKNKHIPKTKFTKIAATGNLVYLNIVSIWVRNQFYS